MATKRSRTKSTRVRRKLRARGTPKWIRERQDLDEMARRRCLMVLSVLSGESPVTEAIAQANISRGTYYQLEERALAAMIASLAPCTADMGPSLADSPAKRIAELEEKVKKLEREKRRSERLLLLTRKVLKPGPMTMAAGRPRKRTKRPRSTTPGSKPSKSSKNVATTDRANPSTPTSGGEGAR